MFVNQCINALMLGHRRSEISNILRIRVLNCVNTYCDSGTSVLITSIVFFLKLNWNFMINLMKDKFGL